MQLKFDISRKPVVSGSWRPAGLVVWIAWCEVLVAEGHLERVACDWSRKSSADFRNLVFCFTSGSAFATRSSNLTPPNKFLLFSFLPQLRFLSHLSGHCTRRSASRMKAFVGSAVGARVGGFARGSLPASSQISAYSRAACRRQLSSAVLASQRTSLPRQSSSASSIPFLRTHLEPQDILLRSSALYARHFHAGSSLSQEQKTKESAPSSEEGAKAEEPREDKKESSEGGEKKAEGEGEGEGEGEEAKNKKKEEAPPPPPPHGDKTPWQVFAETLKTEFKASKEWNESTKQLAAGVEDFTQNENVKRARSAYSKATETASSTTAKVLKTTGSAIGQSAAWTWDTAPVRVIRKGATVTGKGLEKITRPVRETEAYKNVKDVIDDGSSSKYGGWVEKEERRKKREERERKSGKPRVTEKMEEDPKYVHPWFSSMLRPSN